MMASARRHPLSTFPDDFEDEDDRELVKGDDEIYSDLDDPKVNDCNYVGGHVYVADNGIVRCIHCRKQAAVS